MKTNKPYSMNDVETIKIQCKKSGREVVDGCVDLAIQFSDEDGAVRRRELRTGINGSGNNVWLVSTFYNGVCNWIETFKTENEAINWMVWC